MRVALGAARGVLSLACYAPSLLRVRVTGAAFGAHIFRREKIKREYVIVPNAGH